MPPVSQRRQKLNHLGESKEGLVAEWMLLKRSIWLRELFDDDVENCPLLELKHLRLHRFNLLLQHIIGEEHEIELMRFLSRPPYRTVQSNAEFDWLAFTYDVPHFRQMAKMDFPTFLYIVSLIQDH
jgi:hypothetical protein